MDQNELIKALCNLKSMNLKDDLTAINALQILAEKGIKITKQDAINLYDDISKQIDFDRHWNLDKKAPKGTTKRNPQFVPQRGQWLKLDARNAFLSYGLFLKSKKPDAIIYRKAANADNGDFKVSRNNASGTLLAFEEGKTFEGQDFCQRKPELDINVKLDLQKNDLRDINKLCQQITKNKQENPRLAYTYALSPKSIYSDTKDIAAVLATGLDSRGWAVQDNFGAIVDSKGKVVSLLYGLNDRRIIKPVLWQRNKKFLYKATWRKYKDRITAKDRRETEKISTMTYKTIKGYSVKCFDEYTSQWSKYNSAIDDNRETLNVTSIDNLNGFDMLNVTDKDLLNKLIALQVLEALLNKEKTILPDDLAKPIARLIFIQQNKLGTNVAKNAKTQWKDLKDTVNKAMRFFLSHFTLKSGEEDIYFDITIEDLVDYMADVISHKPVSQHMFKLIASGKDTVFTDNKYALQQALNLHLENKIDFATPKQEKYVKSILSRGVQKWIQHVYRIHDDKALPTKNTKTLVHGTSNISVLGILGQGLLDARTLQKRHNKHYNYTGSGLGNGIYFARPDQAEKSLNYTNSDKDRYLFICTVAYHKVDNVKYYDTDLDAKGCDLVWAHGVGSYDRDELLAKHPDQVRLEYIVQFN